MNIETNRLNTFTNWPSSAGVDPIRIARAGFFYTGQGTEVQCFSCGGKISDWHFADQVMCRHRRLDPNCAFVVNPRLSGNVPLVLGQDCPNNETRRDYGVTEEDNLYKNDELRLLSFINWDDNSVSREDLVNSGFYQAGEGRLRCAWCGGELTPYTRFCTLGEPLEVHRMYFPLCTYAAEMEAAQNANNTGSASSPSHTPPVEPTPEICDTNAISSGAEYNARLLANGAPGTWRSLGVVGGGARHPNHSGLASRLATFERWPEDRHQSPQALAEAGFFYTGRGDQVRCFYCDGGLGRWEAGDTPWTEHAHWFPHCGYVLLVKGQEFVDACCNQSSVQRTFSADSGLSWRRRNVAVNFPVTDSQVDECMESSAALAALGAGLDAARVRRALVRRLRATGIGFTSSEALIDAVLDEQLNEESWSVSPHSQRLARDILAETLRDFAPRSGIIPSDADSRPESGRSSSTPPRSPSPQPPTTQTEPDSLILQPDSPVRDRSPSPQKQTAEPEKKLTLEEENRQLKEARICKVCMDSEVSVVFLPCGHLVSCASCGAALTACPMCRSPVRALVRAYLA